MPEISLFYGIKVTMNWKEHNPPHFHVEYAEHTASIDIQKAQIIRGTIPNRHLKLVLAWCELHKDELMQNWELSKQGKPLNRVNPLI